jgi:hypothetical protein
MCDFAWAAVILDDPLGAAVLYERLEPYGDELPYTGNPGFQLVADCLGGLASTLGRYDAAEDWFTRAETIARRLRAPYHLARVRLGRGRMRLRRDADLDAGRPDLEEALAIARRHGFGQIERDSASLLEPKASAIGEA